MSNLNYKDLNNKAAGGRRNVSYVRLVFSSKMGKENLIVNRNRNRRHHNDAGSRMYTIVLGYVSQLYFMIRTFYLHKALWIRDDKHPCKRLSH